MASRAGTRSGTALAAAATAAAAAMTGPAASRVGPAVAMAAAAGVETAARGKRHTRGICNAGSCMYATHAHKRKHTVCEWRDLRAGWERRRRTCFRDY